MINIVSSFMSTVPFGHHLLLLNYDMGRSKLVTYTVYQLPEKHIEYALEVYI